VPLEGLGAHVYPDMFPLAYAETALTADDDLADSALRERLDRLVGAFVDLTRTHALRRNV
jgi:hypothetical protein